MSSEWVFVTGVSGYLGSHVAHQLLEKGYRVRGAARGVKVELSKQAFASYGDKYEVVNVTDVATDDISTHLIGATALIHTAAPLSNRGDPKVILNGAIEGSVNIIRQAAEAGIKKIIYTSSIGAVATDVSSSPDKPMLTAQDWNPLTREVALTSAPFVAYIAAKSLSEKAVWELAEKYELDLTTFCPPSFFGPFATGFSIPSPDYNALSTTMNIYRMLIPKGKYPAFAGYIDVRDLARAHIAALTSPPESSVGRKRLLIASPYDINYQTITAFIAEKRPELKDRLVATSQAPDWPMWRMPVDLKRVKDVLGVELDSYTPWEDTVLETVDNLIKIEKEWIAEGHAVDIPM